MKLSDNEILGGYLLKSLYKLILLAAFLFVFSLTTTLVATYMVENVQAKEIELIVSEAPPQLKDDGGFMYPVKKFKLTSKFGKRWGRLHAGIDLACKTKSKVVAAEAGKVIFAGYDKKYDEELGNLVIIDHQNGFVSFYGHNKKLTVKSGDEVDKGQQIAWSGNTGKSTGPHVHFQINKDGKPVNPLLFLPRGAKK